MTEEEARLRKKAKNLRPLLNLLPLLWAHKRQLLFAFVALIAAAATSLIIPLAVREVIDGSFVQDAYLSNEILIFAGVLTIALALSSSTRFYFVMLLGERISTDLRQKVFSHILLLEPSFFEKIHTGEVISRLSADMTLLRTILASTASIALRNFLLLVGSVSLLLLTSPLLSGLVLALIPLILLPLLSFGRLVRRLARTAQDRLADTGAMANEMLGAIQTVQSATYEPVARQRFATATETAFLSARKRIAARAILAAVIITVSFLGILLTFYQGSLAVIEKEMTAGELGQFILYALMAAGSLAALGEVWGDLQLAAGASERLFELLAEKPRIVSPAQPTALTKPVQGDLRFENVSFSYPTRPDHLVLNDFSLHVPAGTIMALVGMSGEGKSTLFHLIHRFDDPQKGKITLDGVDLRDINLTSLRQQLAYVPQEPALFSIPLAENIRYACPEASIEEVIEAAKKAAAHDFITLLPDGYDMVAGERGQTLSGGQCQRIAIARAFLRDSPILLLDEATSALDSYNEEIVQKALTRLEKKKTVIIVAHRLTTVQRADKIAVMKDGKIHAIGTHQELLERSPLYQQLAHDQLSEPDSPIVKDGTSMVA